jgi:hypothetical protein
MRLRYSSNRHYAQHRKANHRVFEFINRKKDSFCGGLEQNRQNLGLEIQKEHQQLQILYEAE